MKPKEDVNIETFYDFFKTLNDDNTDTDDTADPDFPNVEKSYKVFKNQQSVRFGQYH